MRSTNRAASGQRRRKLSTSSATSRPASGWGCQANLVSESVAASSFNFMAGLISPPHCDLPSPASNYTPMNDALAFLDRRSDVMVEQITRLAAVNSYSHNPDGLAAVAELLREDFA